MFTHSRLYISCLMRSIVQMPKLVFLNIFLMALHPSKFVRKIWSTINVHNLTGIFQVSVGVGILVFVVLVVRTHFGLPIGSSDSHVDLYFSTYRLPFDENLVKFSYAFGY